MKRVSGTIFPIIFLVCKYLIRIVMLRTGWVKTGLVSSCLDMSGVRTEYSLPKSFGKFFDPKFFDKEYSVLTCPDIN